MLCVHAEEILAMKNSVVIAIALEMGYKLCQLVHQNTRGSSILDWINVSLDHTCVDALYNL